MDDDRHFDEEALELAAFRHRIIAEALEADAGEVTAAIQAAARAEYHAPGGAISKPDVLKVAYVLTNYINTETGFAFPSFDRISRTLAWDQANTRVSRALKALKHEGFILMSAGNQNGAHGRKGPSFALVFPDQMTWPDAATAYEVAYTRRAEGLAARSPQDDSTEVGSSICGYEGRREEE